MFRNFLTSVKPEDSNNSNQKTLTSRGNIGTNALNFVYSEIQKIIPYSKGHTRFVNDDHGTVGTQADIMVAELEDGCNDEYSRPASRIYIYDPKLLEPLKISYKNRWGKICEMDRNNRDSARLIDQRFLNCEDSIKAQRHSLKTLVNGLSDLREVKLQVESVSKEMGEIAAMFSDMVALYGELSTAECVNKLEAWKRNIDSNMEARISKRREYYKEMKYKLENQYKELEQHHLNTKRSNAEEEFRKNLKTYRQQTLENPFQKSQHSSGNQSVPKSNNGLASIRFLGQEAGDMDDFFEDLDRTAEQARTSPSKTLSHDDDSESEGRDTQTAVILADEDFE
ncbi:hypothetical protein H4219_001592 [Mycoemilia scoparia]|uniref:Uncharacterized protein n=1 Tax=Mycoemilia scoparia TaxID=417184 RepID=A0A9W8DRP6_9FUNG|nr:hypothetical protein H4219_001592 [Mycoemilia scoparia]